MNYETVRLSISRVLPLGSARYMCPPRARNCSRVAASMCWNWRMPSSRKRWTGCSKNWFSGSYWAPTIPAHSITEKIPLITLPGLP